MSTPIRGAGEFAMKWASSLSKAESYEEAVMACANEVRRVLGSARPDLMLIFPSGGHLGHIDELVDYLQLELEPGLLLGCSGGGVCGGGLEAEHEPALALIAAVLPQVTLTPFHLSSQQLAQPHQLAESIAVLDEDEPEFVLLGDPFSTPIEDALKVFDIAFPKRRKVGGLASGGNQRGENVLLFNGRVLREGMLGLAFTGNIIMDTLVAQGCRPIGTAMFITGCKHNLLTHLNNSPIAAVLQNLFDSLSQEDRSLFQTSLFLGLEMKPKETAYTRGDFLIRNILGFAQDSRTLAIGAELEETMVAQFHLRDAVTSKADLEEHLLAYKKQIKVVKPAGALMFSCLGRGVYLYNEPHYDSRCFHRHFEGVPLGGFFCNGEIGPVLGQTFLHGYTSSFALFHPKT